jgi:CheY-like chemotaxis protein
MQRILIADDNAVSRELAREILEPAGYDVLEAADGREALATARMWIPDVILLDIQMPGLDGYAVLSELRRDPRLWFVRVIAVTAYAMQKDRERAQAAGFDGYLTKPVNAGALRGEVERALTMDRSRSASAGSKNN